MIVLFDNNIFTYQFIKCIDINKDGSLHDEKIALAIC